MAVWAYRGIAIRSGSAVKGVRDAESPKALRAILRRDGVLLTEATEEKERQTNKAKRDIDLLAFFKKPSASDVAVMTRQLATLVRAGVPLVDSLSALMDQVEKETLVKVLGQVRENVNQGTSFAKSLEQHPKIFPSIYYNMVSAGEASGNLESVLERLADFMESQSRLRGKIVSALMYPALMSVVGTVVVTVLMVTVVPKVTAVFDNIGQALPWYTQLLIFISRLLANWWWAIAILISIAVWLFQRWKKSAAGRLKWDRFQLKVILFGRLNLLAAVARFSRTLATLLSSGVQLLRAMEIGSNVLENCFLQTIIEDAISSIREGESIAEPLKRSRAFPPMVTHMIAIGERTGQLEQMLENVARAYEADVETRVTALTSLLEPLMIIVLGVSVGFIVLSILMPLMQMNQLVQ
jgi:general secretion pathway protein F